jgi:hypothetical protein
VSSLTQRSASLSGGEACITRSCSRTGREPKSPPPCRGSSPSSGVWDMGSLIRVTGVMHLGQRVLRVTFSDSLVRELDFAGGLSGVLATIDDEVSVAEVAVDWVAGTVCCPTGIDLDPDVVHGDQPSASAVRPRVHPPTMSTNTPPSSPPNVTPPSSSNAAANTHPLTGAVLRTDRRSAWVSSGARSWLGRGVVRVRWGGPSRGRPSRSSSGPRVVLRTVAQTLVVRRVVPVRMTRGWGCRECR